MDKRLKMLMIEDSESDAELILWQFKKAGYQVAWRRVFMRQELRTALQAESWDVIISDFSLPQFNGLDVIEDYKSSGSDAPFILVSGTIGEETAAKVMKAGAHDYLLKENLSRLVYAVEKELAEAESRRMRQNVEADLKKSEEKFRFMMESLPQIVWMADASGIINYFNPHWYEYTGLDPQADMSKHWERMLHADDEPQLRRLWQKALASGTELKIQCRFLRGKDKTYRWHLGQARVLQDQSGKQMLWLGSFTDIDDQKRAEEAMQQSNEELQRLNQIRSEFISMVSHELRTPLTAIKESISIILDGIDGPVTEDQQDTLSLAQNNVNRLARLIGNVLNFSRLESGKLEMIWEQVDLRAIVNDAAALMRMAAAKKNIELNIVLPPDPVPTVCDSDKIIQVLINLLDNAIKYTPNGGKVSLLMRVSDGEVEMDVSDTGSGIKKEDQEKIFEMFARSFAQGYWKAGGAGVGLAICRRLVEQHHGKISVTSQPGNGSTFSVCLPRQQNVAASSRQVTAAAGL